MITNVVINKFPMDERVFLLNNGPKGKHQPRFPHKHSRIRALFPGAHFTSNPIQATHVIVPDGVERVGERMASRNSVLRHRVVAFSQFVQWYHRHATRETHPAPAAVPQRATAGFELPTSL